MNNLKAILKKTDHVCSHFDCSYFQWVDQPFYGRFDGENYNIGVVNITNKPYPELTSTMQKSNERIYLIGTGEEESFREDVIKIPSIYY